MARRVIGMILILIGATLLLLSGTCTAGVLVMSSDAGVGEMIASGALATVLMVGGPFILLGMLMWWGGLRLRRGRTEDSQGDGSV